MEISSHLRVRDCPVCGNSDASDIAYPARIDEGRLDDFAFASRKLPELMHLRLVRCPRCRTLYASPALTPDFLATAYQDASYDSSEEARFAARTYARHLPRLAAELGDLGTALEVGTGNGAFLGYLREAGFRRVIGLEPSEQAAAASEESIRPLIRLGMFQSGDFEASSLSLLCCFQTIEHVENPRELCQDAYRLLRPGGAIFLVGHDYDSWVTALLGERSPIFDIEHMQLFSKESLRFLLASCGFQDIRIGSIWNCYRLSHWIKLLPIPTGLKRRVIPLTLKLLVGKIPLPMNIGNICAIGFRRGN